MQELRPMLGRSPRSLTRYVNIFRLLKAVDQHANSPEPGDQPSTKRDPDDVTMFLLAVLTAYPDVAQALVTEITRPRGNTEEEDHDNTLSALVTRARLLAHQRSADTHPDRLGPGESQWDLLQKWLDQHEDWARKQRVDTWQRKAQQVARYSYRFDAITPTLGPISVGPRRIAEATQGGRESAKDRSTPEG